MTRIAIAVFLFFIMYALANISSDLKRIADVYCDQAKKQESELKEQQKKDFKFDGKIITEIKEK